MKTAHLQSMLARNAAMITAQHDKQHHHSSLAKEYKGRLKAIATDGLTATKAFFKTAIADQYHQYYLISARVKKMAVIQKAIKAELRGQALADLVIPHVD